MRDRSQRIPVWLTITHLVALGLVVLFAHYPDLCFGVFVLFLGVVTATQKHQDALKLREASADEEPR